MYYGTISDKIFMDLVNKLGLEDPQFFEDIPIPSAFAKIVISMVESIGNPDQITAYFQPRERLVVVKSPDITLECNVKYEYSKEWDKSWENFRFYLPIEYLTNIDADNIIPFAGWTIKSKHVSELFENCLACPPEYVIVTTFETTKVGRTHTVQYS